MTGIVNNLVKQIVVFVTCLILSLLVSKYIGDSEFWIVKHLYASLANINPITLVNSSIPIVDYGYYKGNYIGPQINPITVSDKAMIYYNNYKANSNDIHSKNSLVNAANWLIENSLNHGNYSIFDYKFPWPTYKLIPPWHSGMAQGKALQALIKAHELTGDDRYLVGGKLILNAFFVDVEDGGVTYKTPSEGWWYEEYADRNGVQSRVLNGMMFALLGIHDYYKYTNDTDARSLFDMGIIALKKSLYRYDDNGYSYYDVLYHPAGVYHDVHIDLLSRLYKETNDKVFDEYHDKWQGFKEPYSLIEQIKHPRSPSFVILALNFIALICIFEAYLMISRRWKRK